MAICGEDMGCGFVCCQAEGHIAYGVPHLTMDEGGKYHTLRRLAETAADLLARWPGGLKPLGDAHIREQTTTWLERWERWIND